MIGQTNNALWMHASTKLSFATVQVPTLTCVDTKTIKFNNIDPNLYAMLHRGLWIVYVTFLSVIMCKRVCRICRPNSSSFKKISTAHVIRLSSKTISFRNYNID